MSLLWPDRRRVALRPDAVAVAAVRLFGRPPVLDAVLKCEPQPGAAPWSACLDALGADMEWKPRRSAVSVVLSNHFCQFALLEKPQAITSDAEAASYAKHRMLALYGEQAKDWEVELSAAGKNAWLVCCAPRALLGAVREAFAAKRASVVSIQPYFAAAWTRRGASIRGRSGWFVVHEAKRVVAGLASKRRWVHLAARRCGDTLDDVLDVIDRERELLSERCDARDVWLYGSQIPHTPAEYRDYRIHLVAPPRAGQVEIGKRPLYAMAA